MVYEDDGGLGVQHFFGLIIKLNNGERYLYDRCYRLGNGWRHLPGRPVNVCGCPKPNLPALLVG